MGDFCYSGLKNKITVKQLDKIIKEHNTRLFGDTFRVDKTHESKGKWRAKWCFMFQPDSWWCRGGGTDAAFSLSLLYEDGSNKLEFKILPWRSYLEEKLGFDPQDRLRRSLVRRLNKG